MECIVFFELVFDLALPLGFCQMQCHFSEKNCCLYAKLHNMHMGH